MTIYSCVLLIISSFLDFLFLFIKAIVTTAVNDIITATPIQRNIIYLANNVSFLFSITGFVVTVISSLLLSKNNHPFCPSYSK